MSFPLKADSLFVTYPPPDKKRANVFKDFRTLQMSNYVRLADSEDDSFSKQVLSPWKDELYALLEISIPVAIATVSRIAIYGTDTAFLGRIDKEAMNAVSLAYALEGFLSGIAKSPALILNQLCSQAIGANNPKLAGIWFQIAEAVSLPFCIISSVIMYHIGNILSLFYSNKILIDYAIEFGHYGCFILFLSIQYGVIRQFLQGVFIVRPAMYVSIVFILVNFGLNYMFIFYLGFGFAGAPIATTFSFIGQIILLSTYVFWYKRVHEPFWIPWSRSNFTSARIQTFLSILKPKMAENFMRVCGERLNSLLGGRLDTLQFSSLVIANQVYWTYWAFYWGLGLACQIRVGKHMGNANLPALRLCIAITLQILTPIAIFIAIMNFAFRTSVARVFTSDLEAIEQFESLGLIVSLHFFFDSQKILSNDILSGMSRNSIVMWINTFEMWLIRTPFMVYAVFISEWEDKARWVLWSQVFSAVFAAISSWFFLYATDIEKLSDDARTRAEQ